MSDARYLVVIDLWETEEGRHAMVAGLARLAKRAVSVRALP
jgi:hypothetical protein